MLEGGDPAIFTSDVSTCISYTSNSSHYICPRPGYHVYYVMNCTAFLTKYVYFYASRLLN